MLSINSILVPIDFSDYSLKALDYAIDFSERFNAKLILVFVIEPMIYPTDFTFGEIVPSGFEPKLEENAVNELKKLAEDKIGDKINFETTIRTGRPFLEIISAARELDVDLIIIATHGTTGVEHLLFGSTAEKVVKKAPCPVLTLREPIKGFSYGEK
jgi:universal stress protein A